MGSRCYSLHYNARFWALWGLCSVEPSEKEMSPLGCVKLSKLNYVTAWRSFWMKLLGTRAATFHMTPRDSPFQPPEKKTPLFNPLEINQDNINVPVCAVWEQIRYQIHSLNKPISEISKQLRSKRGDDWPCSQCLAAPRGSDILLSELGNTDLRV